MSDGPGTALNQQMFGKRNENFESDDFFVLKRFIWLHKMMEFGSDRMSYVILGGRWCDTIVLNVHAPTEDTIDDVKGRFYEKRERVFDKFHIYH
jgi:hypothetical protein